LATKFTRRFINTSVDPTTAILDTVIVKLQETIYGDVAGARAITMSTFSIETNSGWRRCNVTNPGTYNLFFDSVLDDDNSPFYIGTDSTAPVMYIYKAVTITGTYNSRETLTTGSGSLASNQFGGTPYFDGDSVEIVIIPTSDRNFYWDRTSLAEAANQISFDVWVSSEGVDDTAVCDIIIYRA
jgi:hypothetical protein